MAGPLGRRPPTDWRHVENFRLTADLAPPVPTPVVLGVNWYSNFDEPEEDFNGEYWIGKGNLGSVRGGHAICVKPELVQEASHWWPYYDQGTEGACVGFGISRAMSLLNRKRYDARWLYKEAQKIDEWDGEDYDGTSVRAGLEVARTLGHKVMTPAGNAVLRVEEKIPEYRWAKSVDEVLLALGYEGEKPAKFVKKEAVPLLNSWGKGYPRKVWLTFDALERLLDEDGEAGIVMPR